MVPILPPRIAFRIEPPCLTTLFVLRETSIFQVYIGFLFGQMLFSFSVLCYLRFVYLLQGRLLYSQVSVCPRGTYNALVWHAYRCASDIMRSPCATLDCNDLRLSRPIVDAKSFCATKRLHGLHDDLHTVFCTRQYCHIIRKKQDGENISSICHIIQSRSP